jgi:condensin complex subunit 2
LIVFAITAAFLDPVEDFQALSICPCLSNFKFSTTDSIQTFEGLAALIDLPEKTDIEPIVNHDTHDTGNDFFDSNDSPNLGEDNFQIPDHEDVDDEGVDMGEAFHPTGIPNQRDLLMALVDDNSKQAEGGQSIFGQESTGMFDYFDKSMKKSWAGPEHWKLRKTVAFKSRESDLTAQLFPFHTFSPPFAHLEFGSNRLSKDDENTTTINRTKREKSTFSFDFLQPLETSRKSIFQACPASLTLPGYKPPKPKSQRKMIKKIVGNKAAIGSKQMLEQHCLPDDMHFNASQLLRFDMKPKTTVRCLAQLFSITFESMVLMFVMWPITAV